MLLHRTTLYIALIILIAGAILALPTPASAAPATTVVVVVRSTPLTAASWTCRNWSCGWLFSKGQTKAMFLAVTAGTAAAAVAVCASFKVPVVCRVVIAVVGAFVGSGVSALNKCLYFAGPRSRLYRC